MYIKSFKKELGIERKAQMVSLVVGIFGALLLGIGMCFVLVWGEIWFVLGVPIGGIGLVGCVAAYPFYCKVCKKERAKIAPEMLRLTEELLKK